MRYELNGGPLDGTEGEIDDEHAGNLTFPDEAPTADDHDPTSNRRNELRYRKTDAIREDGTRDWPSGRCWTA